MFSKRSQWMNSNNPFSPVCQEIYSYFFKLLCFLFLSTTVKYCEQHDTESDLQNEITQSAVLETVCLCLLGIKNQLFDKYSFHYFKIFSIFRIIILNDWYKQATLWRDKTLTVDICRKNLVRFKKQNTFLFPVPLTPFWEMSQLCETIRFLIKGFCTQLSFLVISVLTINTVITRWIFLKAGKSRKWEKNWQQQRYQQK